MTKKNLIPKSKAKTAYELLSEVCAIIREEPKRFNQRVYRATPMSGGDRDIVAPRGFPPGGTVGCVAGWVVTLKGKKPPYTHTPDVARHILGIGTDQSRVLFWYSAAGNQVQTSQHARAGVKHIRAFQKANAAQLKAKRV